MERHTKSVMIAENGGSIKKAKVAYYECPYDHLAAIVSTLSVLPVADPYPKTHA